MPPDHGRDLRVRRRVLDGAVNQQATLAALRAEQVKHKSVEVGADLGDRSARLFQLAKLLRLRKQRKKAQCTELTRG